jgi:rhombotail lipoprotein
MKIKTKVLILGLVIAATGCATWYANKTVRRASVVDYLYPDKNAPAVRAAVPTLELPLQVGVAFVPGSPSRRYEESELTEKQRVALMESVGGEFKKYPFIKSVNPIPSAYLTSGGSFANLDQICRMFDVDVMVLLSYDQVQFTDQGLLAWSYWTIVGAAVVEGEHNDTHTMLDAVVYHVPSRKMLFRAPGTSRVRASATPVDLRVELRKDGQRGFELAATNLVVNLQEQLVVFKEKVKNAPEEYKVQAKPGYDLKAVGAIDPVFLLALLGIAGGLYLCLQPQNAR